MICAQHWEVEWIWHLLPGRHHQYAVSHSFYAYAMTTVSSRLNVAIVPGTEFLLDDVLAKINKLAWSLIAISGPCTFFP